MRAFLMAFCLLAAGIAQGAPADCTFKPRPNDFYFRELPKEIVGLITCAGPLNTFFVVRTNADFMTWFKSYERVATVAPLSTSMVATKSELEIKTRREVDAVDHLVFSGKSNAGSQFYLLYTDTPARMINLRGQVQAVGRSLASPEFVSQIDRVL